MSDARLAAPRTCVRRLRQDRHWSQAELAQRAGVPAPTISHLERGRIHKPSYDLIAKLAAAFDVAPSDLFVDPTQEAA